MSLYSRLNTGFDSSRFGNGQLLSQNDSNNYNLITTINGPMPSWQQRDLATGIVRTNYFQNPTKNYLTTITAAANALIISANQVGDSTTTTAATNLILEISKFQSHTDNISGVATVTDASYPSFETAHSVGQVNMLNLSQSDGVSNTASILGSFTSLFINDMLSSNANTILAFSSLYANSISSNTTLDVNLMPITVYTSNLSPTQIANIQSYVSNTNSLLTTRRTSDWSFYTNSLQLSRDVTFMQQFNNMSSTGSYMLQNLVGTQRVLSNTASKLITLTTGATGTANTLVANVSSAALITDLGVVSTGTWHANIIETSFGGTGLSSFNARGAVYATTANTLATGTLPVTSGGTGTTVSTGAGFVVLNTSPILTSANLVNPTLSGTTLVSNASITTLSATNLSATNLSVTNVAGANINSTVMFANNATFANITFANTTTGNIIPSIASTYNLGSANNRWANVYTSDLNLSNEAKGGNDIDGTTGNWTIQEGADNLYIINNKTGKKYKFSLEEL